MYNNNIFFVIIQNVDEDDEYDTVVQLPDSWASLMPVSKKQAEIRRRYNIQSVEVDLSDVYDNTEDDTAAAEGSDGSAPAAAAGSIVKAVDAGAAGARPIPLEAKSITLMLSELRGCPWEVHYMLLIFSNILSSIRKFMIRVQVVCFCVFAYGFVFFWIGCVELEGTERSAA